MGEDLIENEIYVAKLVGSDLQGNDLYKFEPLKQISNAPFVKATPEFKRGDILKSTITPDLTVIFDKTTSTTSFDSIYHNWDSSNHGVISNHGWKLNCFRHATEEEKQEFFDELEADGKRWNAERMIIENIPQPKFKIGKSVTLKSGCASKDGLTYLDDFNKLIGGKLTIKGYMCDVLVHFNETKFTFHEDWLEPYVEELKKGDLAIFWDNNCLNPTIRLYHGKSHRENKHYDNIGTDWDNAVKWDGTKEQFEKILRGEI